MALYDLEFIKTMTGIEDDTTAAFYADAVLARIQKIIGYNLAQASQKDYISGVGTSYIWLLRKPVTAITEVKIDDKVLTVTEDYTTRNLTNTPHIILEDSYLCDCEEAEVTNTAGYKEFGAGEPQLTPDILMLIIQGIKSFESSVDNGGLESYKIDTINYKFITWINSSMEFYMSVADVFGVAI